MPEIQIQYLRLQLPPSPRTHESPSFLFSPSQALGPAAMSSPEGATPGLAPTTNASSALVPVLLPGLLDPSEVALLQQLEADVLRRLLCAPGIHLAPDSGLQCPQEREQHQAATLDIPGLGIISLSAAGPAAFSERRAMDGLTD